MAKKPIPHEVRNNMLSVRRIRKAIGWLAFGLPVTLLILSLISFFDTAIQRSISAYYFTNLREILTGTLCAVGFFLIGYKRNESLRFWLNENLFTTLAGIMAILVAFFPSTPADCADKVDSFIPLCDNALGILHYVFAGVLFFIMAYMSIVIFRRGQEKNENIRLSRWNENNIYLVCGILILVFMAMVPIGSWLNLFYSSTMLFEGLILWAFGIAWLIKGRALGDRGRIGRVLYREEH